MFSVFFVVDRFFFPFAVTLPAHARIPASLKQRGAGGPLDERRKIMEEQATEMVDYYKTTNLWESLEGEEDEHERGTKNGKRDD